MHFVIDAQLRSRLAVWLSGRGHEAAHVRDLGLADKPDEIIAQYAASKGAVILMKDADFVYLARQTSCRVVWLRLGNASYSALVHQLEPVLQELVHALEEGHSFVELKQ